MERHFESELRGLKDELIRMAGFVEKAIECAVEAIGASDEKFGEAKFKQIFGIEEKVNQAHKDVDEACVRLLALQQPLAADLRLIVAIIKINTDLERMGDQAVNIARNSERVLKVEPIEAIDELRTMGNQVRSMVRGVLDSFVTRNEKLAFGVLSQDDIVDESRNRIFQRMKEYLRDHPTEIEHGLNVIFIARNLERIGDHATNIAEDVIFAVSGVDVRHSKAELSGVAKKNT